MARELIRLGLSDARDGMAQFENPSVPLASLSGLFSWLGATPTAAGESVTTETALQLLDVYAAIRVIAESCAALPLHLMERLASGRRIADDAAGYDLLTVSANPEMAAHTFKECMFACLAATGNAYAQIQWDGSTPVALWPLHPRKTEPVRLGDGALAYRTTDGMANGSYRYVMPEDMIHVLLYSFDGLRGTSPIEQARQAIGASMATEKFSARWFGNGARPSGVMSLKTPGVKVDPKTKQELRDSWNREQGGQNQNSVAWITGDWTYQSIGVTPEDSQFLETRQFQRTQIAALFRLPPHYLGDTSRLSNNSTEQQSLSFVQDTLTPYLVKLENELNRKLLPKGSRDTSRYYYRFDLAERLRGDFATTMKGYADQKQWGIKTTNEIRAELGLSVGGPEGDVLWCPVNMMNAQRLLVAPPATPDAPEPVPTEPADDTRAALDVIFRDAFRRALSRDKRDASTIQSIFAPIVTALHRVELASVQRAMALSGWDGELDKITRDVLATLSRRAAKWTANDQSASEYARAVRAIKIELYRAAGATRAMQELEDVE